MLGLLKKKDAGFTPAPTANRAAPPYMTAPAPHDACTAATGRPHGTHREPSDHTPEPATGTNRPATPAHGAPGHAKPSLTGKTTTGTPAPTHQRATAHEP